MVQDPHLGYHMAYAVTTGIQSEGVVATAKHFVDNSQETDRGTVTEVPACSGGSMTFGLFILGRISLLYCIGWSR